MLERYGKPTVNFKKSRKSSRWRKKITDTSVVFFNIHNNQETDLFKTYPFTTVNTTVADKKKSGK